MLQEDIKKYYGVDGLVAEDVMDSPRLFIDYGNPFIERPIECQFSRDAETFSAALNWKSISSEKMETIRKQMTGLDRPDYGVTEFSDNAYWISLPSFQTSDENTKQLKGIIKTVGEMAETLQKADAIVFDMRGNTGGNSSWGDQILKTLWGREIFDHAGRGWSYIDWRVSEGNIRANNYYANLYLGIEGEEGGRVKYFRRIATALQKESDAGNTFYRITNRTTTKDQKPEPPKAKVFLLTNYTCFSAFLDFSDTVKTPVSRQQKNCLQRSPAYRPRRRARRNSDETRPGHLQQIMPKNRFRQRPHLQMTRPPPCPLRGKVGSGPDVLRNTKTDRPQLC
jgi:hypothetical protein